MEKAVMSCFKVLFQHLPGWTVEIHERPWSREPVSRLLFEPGTLQI